MPYDFKKELKELYSTSTKPKIVHVEKTNYIAIRGKGNPNDPNGEYQRAIPKLYQIAYTLRMSYKTDYKIKDFFEYVVPPLEGFWWQEGINGYDVTKKDLFSWISLIRLPDFITLEDFNWAKQQATIKNNKNYDDVEFLTYDEGLCVQCCHIGPFDNEFETVKKMNEYLDTTPYNIDLSPFRHHHEIYLSDPRKTSINKLKTIIRHPIK